MDLGQQVEQRLVHGLSRHPPVPESPGTHAPRFSCRVGGRRRGGRAGSGIRDWGLGPGRLEQWSHGRRQAGRFFPLPPLLPWRNPQCNDSGPRPASRGAGVRFPRSGGSG
jgi:hypothetical protein